jgi:nuclear GTP-binding protein
VTSLIFCLLCFAFSLRTWMVQKKAKSKRKTLKAKYKIQRKCREHNRKMRKLKKIGFIAKVSKKDPGIPNLWPFKEVFIKQLKVRRKEEELEKFQKRQHLRALSENLYSLAEDASKKEIDYDIKAKLVSDQISQEHCIDNTRKFFFKELKKVVNDSDVILEVLDARDPLGCRCKQLEDLVLGGEGEKKLVLVLNKVDLIPKDVAQQWLKHLRKTLPAVAFKASTHQRRQFLVSFCIFALFLSQ